MINLKIDKDYKLPDTWDELTLDKASAIFSVPMPEKLKQFYDFKVLKKGEQPEITDKDLKKVFPFYYGSVLSVFIPKEVIDKVMAKDRTLLYTNYMMEFVLGLHYAPNFTAKGIEYIDCDGERLFLPKPKEILGDKIPMAYESAFAFTESADLELHSDQLKGGRYDVLANITSVLCRPIGEEYDEDTSLVRAEKLKTMKMSDAWEVFFCFNELLAMQNKRDHLFLERKIAKLKPSRKELAYQRGTELLSKWGKRFRESKTLKA